MTQLTLVDKLLWASGFLLNFALLGVLVLHRRARSAPWFTAWIAFQFVRDTAMFVILQRYDRAHAYLLAYWVAAAVELLLQIAVVLEIARSVFYRSGTWVPEARRKFILLASSAPVAALILAAAMTPAASRPIDAWYARASLFMTAVICLMCTAVMAVSRQLGLGWRERVLQFSWGLVVWSLASFMTDTLHSYWRTIDQFGKLENTLTVVYQLVSLYWIAIFWFPEQRAPAMPERALKDMTRITERLGYSRSRHL